MARRIAWHKIRWGTLTDWLRRHESELKRKTGMNPFTRDGEINDRLLRKLYHDKELLRDISGSHWKKIWRKIHFKLNVLNKAIRRGVKDR